MPLPIPGILKADELALVRSWLAVAHFVDGRLSAGAAARRVKTNEELVGGAPDLERLDLSLPFIPSAAETLEFFIATGYPFRHA